MAALPPNPLSCLQTLRELRSAMAHHKRRRAKKQRAGCLYCKPHKGNGVGADRTPPSVRRKMQDDVRALAST